MKAHQVVDMRDWPDIWDEGDAIVAMLVLHDRVWVGTNSRVYVLLEEGEEFEDIFEGQEKECSND